MHINGHAHAYPHAHGKSTYRLDGLVHLVHVREESVEEVEAAQIEGLVCAGRRRRTYN